MFKEKVFPVVDKNWSGFLLKTYEVHKDKEGKQRYAFPASFIEIEEAKAVNPSIYFRSFLFILKIKKNGKRHRIRKKNCFGCQPLKGEN